MPANDTNLTPEKQALLALRNMKRKLEELERARTEPVAIVGIGCRYPGGVTGPDSFWQLLRGKVDAIQEIPPERFRIDDIYDPDPTKPGKTNTRWAGLLDHVDEFDPEFFGISPREAVRMDPQQRLFLEVAWEALEHAGINPKTLAGTSASVFAGVTVVEYSQLRHRVHARHEIDAYDIASSVTNATNGRVSYFLGLHGPSMAIDTACSSSLVAVDRACRSVRDGESRLAIAGGVNVLAVPESLIAMARWGMVAPDGRCKAFDALADGFVRAEGCGIVVLKRLSDALADNDRILAVIRGSAVNQDGASSGLTVPNGVAQEAVLRQALSNSGVRPSEVTFVEAHGTGTSLGDPIEAEALGNVFREGREPGRPLLIGSVKTNIGHAESAAGIAGLIKVVLGLEYREVPAQLHWHNPSPHIHWSELPLLVVCEPTPWEPIGGRRIAGVSSFGLSGTNAHVVLEEAPAPKPVEAELERPVQVLTLTARSDNALRQLAGRYAAHITAHPDERWEDVCYTANVGRAHFAERLSVRAAAATEGVAALEAFVARGTSPALVTGHVRVGSRPKVAFLFTGQGSQFSGMGRELYASSPRFREILDRCDEVLKGELEAPLGAVMRGEHPDAAALLDQTLYTQPALFAFEYALAELWRSWGVEPGAVLGHSLGEFVAAALAGVFSFEDGLRLVAKRARLMHGVRQGGAMLAVDCTEPEAAAALAGFTQQVSIAAVNGPLQIVISGLREAVVEVQARLAAQGRQTRFLRVSQAFHSPLMDSIADEFERHAAALPGAAPRLKLISNVTGGAIDNLTAAYWRRHLREPVRFEAQIRELERLGYDVLIEIGPKSTLIALGQHSATAGWGQWIPSLRSNTGEWESLSRAVQEVDSTGVEIDWNGWDRGYQRRRLSLPTYPFERQRYWVKSSGAAEQERGGRSTGHPLLGVRLRSALEGAQFEARITPQGETPWIADHRLSGRVILPGTAYAEMMLAAGIETFSGEWRQLQDVAILEPLEFEGGEARTVQVIVDGAQGDSARVRIFSNAAGSEQWRLHAEGSTARLPQTVPGSESLEAIRARCTEVLTPSGFYEGLRQRGVEFGPAFLRLREIVRSEGEALGTIPGDDDLRYRLHPAVLDACLQVAAAALPDGIAAGELYVPVSFGRLRWYGSPGASFFCHAHITSIDTQQAVHAELRLLDARGELLGEVDGIRFARLRLGGQAADTSSWLYEVAWTTAPHTTPVSPVEGHWLILADSGGFGTALAKELTAKGARCSLADGVTGVAPAIRKAAETEPLSGILHLRGLDSPALDAITADQLIAGQMPGYGAALETLQALLREQVELPRGLWLISRGDNALRALRRTAAMEHPDLRSITIDIDTENAQQLVSELGYGDEPEVAFRGGARYVSRLVRHETAASKDNKESVQLLPSPTGLLEDLEYRRAPRKTPGPDEVEVEVRATGLNFRDVLNALGMMPGMPRILGGECAGVVVTAGAASGYAPGDEVIAFAAGAFHSHVVSKASGVVRKPAALSFAEAASLPIAYLTALYGLNDLARIQAGDTILIHAGTGGLGLAAVHLALAAGAQVYSTAGNDEKRDYLRSLGVRHVFNSRTLDFAPELMEATGGRGVDIVLNSLAGEFIEKSFSVLTPGGRFIEVGKRGILTPEQAHQLRPDAAYFAFDLGEEGARDTSLIPRLLKEMLAGLEDGRVKILPLALKPFAEAQHAFRTMAQARHTGKLVITYDVSTSRRPVPRSDATYLITGGTGALGLQTAKWLVDGGARSLILASRTGLSASNSALVRELEASGASVTIVRADAADREEMARVLASIPYTAPLRGIVHAAGILEDSLLPDQTWDSFVRVASPKALGAWNLHELTRGWPLDFFILFSSASSILGSGGQANYAASNALLDSLAQLRHAHGRPALSINWGPWSESGMAAAPGVNQRLEAFGRIDARTAFPILDAVLAGGVAQVSVLPVRSWDALLSRSSVATPFFSNVRGVAQPEPAISFAERLKAGPASAQRKLLLDHLAAQTARILAFDSLRRIDDSAPLHDLGLDSLMAVELRNALIASLGQPLPPTVVLDHPTLANLADYILKQMTGGKTPEVKATPAVSEIAALSEDEAEALLLEELGMNTNAAPR